MTADEVKRQPLILEFLTWVERAPRTYAETMDAWRTSCPRSSVWEDAWLGGLVLIENPDDSLGQRMVCLTPEARALLSEVRLTRQRPKEMRTASK